MVKRRGPPSQGWQTFLHNHAPDIAAMDLFVVPTIGFDLLYAFVIVRLERRDLVWVNVTANPRAEWVARQTRRFLGTWPRAIRSEIFTALSSRAGCAPWGSGTGLPHQPRPGSAERLIGSIRRECLDHVVIWGEAHLRRILKS